MKDFWPFYAFIVWPAFVLGGAVSLLLFAAFGGSC